VSEAIKDELEVKFFDVDLDSMREQLEQTGASLKVPERLMRRVVFGGEDNPGMTCTYGRIRDEGDAITMSAKFSAVNGEIASQKEAMVEVDDFDSAYAVLTSFGLKPSMSQENKRETWQYPDGTLVELEQWPELPAYIEIEGASELALRGVATHLGLDWDAHTTDSTDKLYRQHYPDLSEDEARGMLADLRFAL
jgi:adenylate cyclase class 2